MNFLCVYFINLSSWLRQNSDCSKFSGQMTLAWGPVPTCPTCNSPAHSRPLLKYHTKVRLILTNVIWFNLIQSKKNKYRWKRRPLPSIAQHNQFKKSAESPLAAPVYAEICYTKIAYGTRIEYLTIGTLKKLAIRSRSLDYNTKIECLAISEVKYKLNSKHTAKEFAMTSHRVKIFSCKFSPIISFMYVSILE